MKIIADEDIVSSYKRLGSVWRVGDELGTTGQLVHKRLQRMGVDTSINRFTPKQDEDIKRLYQDGFKRGDGRLDALCKSMNRTKSIVCRRAKTMGLTTYSRKICDEMVLIWGEKTKRQFAKNGHPKGMLGKKMSAESIKKISVASKKNYAKHSSEKRREIMMKTLKTRAARGTLITNRQKTTWKGGWREIGGKRMYLRSQWEEAYAMHLERLKTIKTISDWLYEEDTFWFDKIKRGVRSYTPDFKVLYEDGSFEYHEVKGWMDDRSITKLKRMRIYHPNVKIVVIDSKVYNSMFDKNNNPRV